MRSDREKGEKRIATIRDQRRKRDEWRTHHETYFEKFDALLDSSTQGPRWLSQEAIAGLVQEAILYRDGREYTLEASTIMPNHVHMVCTIVGRSGTPSTREGNDLGGRNTIPTYRMLQSLKRHTARKANIILSRFGAFWQDESYDHVIRDGEELERTIWYVLNNPVKAGLVRSREQWKWTYCKQGLV